MWEAYLAKEKSLDEKSNHNISHQLKPKKCPISLHETSAWLACVASVRSRWTSNMKPVRNDTFPTCYDDTILNK